MLLSHTVILKYNVTAITDRQRFMVELKLKAETVLLERKKPKRTRQIRVTEETYQELIKLGSMTDDFEDVISRLLKERKAREPKK